MISTQYALLNKTTGYDENVLSIAFGGAFITVVTAIKSVRLEVVDGVPTSDEFQLVEGEAQNVYGQSEVVEDVAATEEVAEEAAKETKIEDETADKEIDLTLGSYTIIGEAEFLNEDGTHGGFLDVGQTYELPVAVGDDLVARGVAEKATEEVTE